MRATLILENGSTFVGKSIGSTEDRVCEMVFNTSMVGYQEILTDPSYAGQGVVMSYPLIGNYGVNSEDNQSRQPWVEAFVVRHLSERGSNFRCEGALNDYLKEHHITGIEGVDTRALTKLLRSQGSMNGMITCAEHFSVAEVMEQLKAYRVSGMVEQTTCGESHVCNENGRYNVACLDFGTKQNLIESLTNRDCRVTVFPAHTPAETILSGGFDGVMLSNGPGDPADCGAIVSELKKLLDANIPVFGIGLGHQLMALAGGARTERLAYGHRGSNHPVKDLKRGRVYISSQNHGYVVAADSVDPAVAEVSHINVNDGTVEGLRYKNDKCFTVQFYPDSSSGAVGTDYLFDDFIALMGGNEHA